MRIAEVSLPVLAERPVGTSRIMSSVLKYAVHSAPVLTRAIRDYSPMKFFGFVSFVTFVLSFLIGVSVFIHWLQTGQTVPYTQFITVSVGGVLLSFLLGMIALMADLIGRLRYQVEELLYESRKLRAEHKPGSHRAA